MAKLEPLLDIIENELEEEEEVVGRSVMDAYFREIAEIPVLTAKQEITATKAELVRSALKLVVSIVRKGYLGEGRSFLDLIQEGNMGLIVAANRWDPNRGTRFCTYAGQWVHKMVMGALSDTGHTIRIPQWTRAKMKRVKEAAESLTRESGREPETEEVAEKVGLSVKKVTELRNVRHEEPISLDVSIGEGMVLADCIPCQNQGFGSYMAPEEAQEALKCLTDKERLVMVMRFGIGGERNCSYEEIGKELNLTRQRIRQIEAIALGKLREAIQAGGVR